MKRQNEKDTDVMSSIIGADARFSGKLFLEGSARIDGTYDGVLTSEGTVTIGHRGLVTGEIEADQVVVGGKIVGSIVAKSRLVLESTAVLEGDLATTNLTICEGASFNGHSRMGQEAVDELKKLMKLSRDPETPERSGITLYDDDGSPLDDDLASTQAG